MKNNLPPITINQIFQVAPCLIMENFVSEDNSAPLSAQFQGRWYTLCRISWYVVS